MADREKKGEMEIQNLNISRKKELFRLNKKISFIVFEGLSFVQK